MDWLEHARREIQKVARQPTANSAERNPTAAMAVLLSALCVKSKASICSNGGVPSAHLPALEAVRRDFEERAAIMEFDGGLSRDEAEREAWKIVLTRYRLH